jgi:ProP effector
VADGTLDRKEIGGALRYYCGRLMYQRAMVLGAQRVDFAGQPAGVVTEADVANAQRSIAGLLKQREDRAAAAKADRVAGRAMRTAEKTEAPAQPVKEASPAPKPAARPVVVREGLAGLKAAIEARRAQAG